MEDARWASSVQLAVAEDVSFGSSREPLGLGPIHRKHFSNEAIKERSSPVRVLIGLGRSCVDFHGLKLGGGGLGDKGGLGPCDGLNRWALFYHRGVADGGLVEVSSEDVWGDRGPCRRHLCQFVCGLVEFSRNVIEFETIELVF